MAVQISGVLPGSAAAEKRLRSGQRLLSLNGHVIMDVLDYRFYMREPKLLLELEEGGKRRRVTLKKAEEEDPGLLFETYLMDKQRHCANRCMFCFIDQLPPGMRESLYFKDDDARLSFLLGNYITLTNLGEREVQRILEMHISPVHISVHTMNPELRVSMMGNPKAGAALEYLRRFAEAGIQMHTQLVLCPGVNDGVELCYSLEQLGALYPAVQSIAAVPVGLTKYRTGLPEILPYTTEGAKAVLREINAFNTKFLCYNKIILAYAADEFYLKAGMAIPDAAYYGDFPQLENGVGMWALFREEFYNVLENYARQGDASQPFREQNKSARTISVATGTAAYPLISQLAEDVCGKLSGLTVRVYAVENAFFGEEITVSGLLTGGDIIRVLRDEALGEVLLIPANALRREGDVFLDDVTPEQLETALHTKVEIVPVDGAAFLAAILGEPM